MPVDYEIDPTDHELSELQRRLLAAKREIDPTGGYSWTIACPHCDADLTVLLPRAVVDTVSRPEPHAKCLCKEAHPKRPKDVTLGCGFEAMVPLTIGTGA